MPVPKILSDKEFVAQYARWTENQNNLIYAGSDAIPQLLAEGANPNAYVSGDGTNYGTKLAAAGGEEDSVTLRAIAFFKKKNGEGIDLNFPTSNGTTALRNAVFFKRPENIKFLREKHVDLDKPAGDGLTPLMALVGYGAVNTPEEIKAAKETIDALLSFEPTKADPLNIPANPYLKMKDGPSALELAQPNIKEYLQEKMAAYEKNRQAFMAALGTPDADKPTVADRAQIINKPLLNTLTPLMAAVSDESKSVKEIQDIIRKEVLGKSNANGLPRDITDVPADYTARNYSNSAEGQTALDMARPDVKEFLKKTIAEREKQLKTAAEKLGGIKTSQHEVPENMQKAIKQLESKPLSGQKPAFQLNEEALNQYSQIASTDVGGKAPQNAKKGGGGPQVA